MFLSYLGNYGLNEWNKINSSHLISPSNKLMQEIDKNNNFYKKV